LVEQSAFTPEEQQTILISVSAENRCAYCVAAHSCIAKNMVKVSADTVNALRDGQPLSDAKLNALVEFTKAIVRERGWVAESPELKGFLAVGYTNQHALEVVLGVTMKTLSNYANHLTNTPLDAPFVGEAWEAADPQSGSKQ
jgi:AhpD family alkylhydroperoxidase